MRGARSGRTLELREPRGGHGEAWGLSGFAGSLTLADAAR